ncbi:MAG: HlyC/CorC family transporter [Alphaproteobacteria bacterium]|nr:HlyC/CorC family transporter [Alphaproteobacteria bacterium]
MPDDDTTRSLSSEPGRVSVLRRLAQLLRGGSAGKTIRESLEQAIEQVGRDDDALSPQERLMLANLLKFGELRVDDVMVPRADIVAVEEGITLNELLAAFREAQHSRLPLYRETLDDPVGLIHIKDVFSLLEPQADGSLRWPDISISRIKRDLLFVPPSMPAHELLLKMQSSHMHLALVIDEYGGTDGLVSIEDLVEEIVGDIDDEHDVDDTPQLRPLPSGGYDVDARFDLEDFRDSTGIALSPSDVTEDIDTLGGLVMSRLGRVPQRGEIVPYPPDYEFEVLEADPRRIKRLRLRPLRQVTPAKGA